MKFTGIILFASILLCLSYTKLHAQYLGGSGDGYAAVTSDDIVLAIDEPAIESVPEAFQLYQNYPNPFNPETRIRFDIPARAGNAMRAQVSITNIRGQVVRVLLDETRPPGSYELSWDGKNEKGFPVPSGMYMYTIRFGKAGITKKMLLLK